MISFQTYLLSKCIAKAQYGGGTGIELHFNEQTTLLLQAEPIVPAPKTFADLDVCTCMLLFAFINHVLGCKRSCLRQGDDCQRARRRCLLWLFLMQHQESPGHLISFNFDGFLILLTGYRRQVNVASAIVMPCLGV